MTCLILSPPAEQNGDLRGGTQAALLDREAEVLRQGWWETHPELSPRWLWHYIATPDSLPQLCSWEREKNFYLVQTVMIWGFLSPTANLIQMDTAWVDRLCPLQSSKMTHEFLVARRNIGWLRGRRYFIRHLISNYKLFPSSHPKQHTHQPGTWSWTTGQPPPPSD